MSKICANQTITGCISIVTQRGNLLCDSCIEARKTSAKSRRDVELDQLTERNRGLEEKIKVIEKENLELKTSLQQAQEQVKLLQEDSKKLGYNEHLENESIRLSEMLSKVMSENETLVREKGTFDIVYEQLKLDLERGAVENGKLTGLVAQLSEENAKLQKENKELFETLEAKANPSRGIERVVSMPLLEVVLAPEKVAPAPEKVAPAPKPPSKILGKSFSENSKPKPPAKITSPKSKLASRIPPKPFKK